MGKIFHQLTWDDRIVIDTMKRDGKSEKEIAERVGVHISTIYREQKRGRYTHKNSDWTTEERYSPDIAHQRYRANLHAKGADLKIGKDKELADHIENKIINEKYSPAAVLGEIKRKGLAFAVRILSPHTIYNYIDKGVFLKLTNDHLPVREDRRRKYRRVRVKRAHAPKGDSIEKRPAEVADRETPGHWEMDTVKGKRDTKATILVLTERTTRDEIPLWMADGTTESVVAAMDKLERRYGELFPVIFQSFTIDNGSEFADCAGLERSCLREGEKRTKVFYCHPWSSFERGSNENQNKMIRRWIPKGTPIENYTPEEIDRIGEWINNYPREMFGWATSADRFKECFGAILGGILNAGQPEPAPV